MPRGSISKEELKVRVLKLKNNLYNGHYQEKNCNWHDGAHSAYNLILDILDEYAH